MPAVSADIQHDITADERDIGDPLDFATAIQAGADYLRMMQADVTEDNAGNGYDGSDEDPDDPDDGGWDWRLYPPGDPYSHSVNPSPTNLYGATAQGLLRAYEFSGGSDAAIMTAMTDAADVMIANPNVRSAQDLIFLMNYGELVGDGKYADSARVKFDARIATYGSANGLAVYIRDVRGVTQGYANGIIAWDIGPWVLAAAMLEELYPEESYDYAQAADDMAEVIWQDSFNDSPGYFDIEDDKGYDPNKTNKDFWWYNLGVYGLIIAFESSDTHTSDIPFLVDRLLESRNRYGFFSYQWGGNDNDANWQTTAYAVMALAMIDQANYQLEISRAAYWTGATQHGSGGWVYGDTMHYPEIGGENTAAICYGLPPEVVVVDDDFDSQEAVDVYNATVSGSYVWGYDAFASIQEAVTGATVREVIVLEGLYTEPVDIEGAGGKAVSVTVTGAGQSSTVFQPTTTVPWDVGGYSRQTGIRVVGADATFTGMTMDFDLIKASEVSGILYWNATGELSENLIQNMNVPDNFNGYREITCYFRAPDFTAESRARIDVLNNTFLKTGRIGIVTHEYVDVLIDGNSFDKVEDDFGYGIELGSASTGIITNNTFANYDTWAASDASTVAAIMVEAYYTDHIVDPTAKPVVIENNEIYNCQYGLYIGTDRAGYAGDVDMDLTIKNNYIHDNATSGSYSVGGMVIVDKNLDAGASITALIDSNTIENNVYNGIYIYTDGNGDIAAEITYNTINGHYDGIRVAEFIEKGSKSVYDLSIHHNILDNDINARDDIAGGYWDDGVSVGNCWSDYEDNSGFPDQYDIDGNAGTIDRFPNVYCGDLCDCIPGDADGNGNFNILDITLLVAYLYKSGPPATPYETCSGDADCNCSINLLDITALISYIYKSGPPPCDCESWVDNCGWPPVKTPIATSTQRWHQTAEKSFAPAEMIGTEGVTIHPAPAFR